MSDKSIFQLKMDILSSQIGNEIVLLDVASGKYFKIDEIGSSIWEHLREPKTLENLVEILMNEYDVQKEQCLNDVSKFLEELKSNDFLMDK